MNHYKVKVIKIFNHYKVKVMKIFSHQQVMVISIVKSFTGQGHNMYSV